jgi:FixJ family two-component response regulator
LKEGLRVLEQPEIICVVDDDAAVLKALGRLLRSAGLQMMPFADPRLFLEHVKSHVIALAIVDVWMPELNGLEVQRLLHNIAPATPVIIMTGRDDPGMDSVAFAQGAIAFFTKPFDDGAFLKAIHLALPASN